MQFTTVFASALAMASAAYAAPTPQASSTSTPAPSGDYIFKIDQFYARKYDGKTANAVGFNISATNGGTLNFACTPYDIDTNTAVLDGFQEDTLYSCGDNSLFYFAWQSDRNGLVLKQSVSDEIQLVGTATVPNYCHAGGSGPYDLACVGVADAYVTMVQEPAGL